MEVEGRPHSPRVCSCDACGGSGWLWSGTGSSFCTCCCPSSAVSRCLASATTPPPSACATAPRPPQSASPTPPPKPPSTRPAARSGEGPAGPSIMHVAVDTLHARPAGSTLHLWPILILLCRSSCLSLCPSLCPSLCHSSCPSSCPSLCLSLCPSLCLSSPPSRTSCESAPPSRPFKHRRRVLRLSAPRLCQHRCVYAGADQDAPPRRPQPRLRLSSIRQRSPPPDAPYPSQTHGRARRTA
jgi:hypothetical protein